MPVRFGFGFGFGSGSGPGPGPARFGLVQARFGSVVRSGSVQFGSVRFGSGSGSGSDPVRFGTFYGLSFFLPSRHGLSHLQRTPPLTPNASDAPMNDMPLTCLR